MASQYNETQKHECNPGCIGEVHHSVIYEHGRHFDEDEVCALAPCWMTIVSLRRIHEYSGLVVHECEKPCVGAYAVQYYDNQQD